MRTGEVQLIFQQPAASMNPRFTAADVVEEPLVIRGRGDRRAQAAAAMKQVGLDPGDLDKLAQHFSGGEKQRLAIARALVLEPKLLILDESLTGLDPALQAQMVALLHELPLTYLLVTHDLDIAVAVATEIAVMESGRLVEHGRVDEVLAAPRHPLTCELLAAARALVI